MFTVYQDMRVSRGGRMAGGLVDDKLSDCHLMTTVTPTQVFVFIIILFSLNGTNMLNVSFSFDFIATKIIPNMLIFMMKDTLMNGLLMLHYLT